MAKRIVITLILAALLVALMAASAVAHNSAHVVLDNGKCVELGSGKSVTLPDGAQAGSIVEAGEKHLDLIPGPGDQFGARFAAEHSPALEPRGC